ncbi:MAG: RNA polymerase sigma factor [Planctomyces sp.]|nr:sigma-70 family RNA polymerase sigma factor [Planctomyces sp.]
MTTVGPQPSDDQNAPIGSPPPDAPDPRAEVEAACLQLQKTLKLFLLGLLRQPQLAEDAYQRTFVQAIQAAQAVRLPTLKGWLFRIALNEARGILREQKRLNSPLPNSSEGSVSPELLSTHSGLAGTAEPEPQQLLLREEVRQAVRESLKSLPADQQQVIHRRIYEGKTFAEIAADMNLPLGTVLTWMRRGLLRLREDRKLKQFLDE